MIKTELLLKKTNISLSNLSSQSKNKSDTPSNKVVMENEKINTKNVPIGIPTIQKSVPKSAGTTCTKNNMIGGNEKEKSSSSGMISTDLIDLDEKINTKPNIDPGTVTTTIMTNFDDTPAKQKIKTSTTW